MLKRLVQLSVAACIAFILATVIARSGKTRPHENDPYRYFKTFAKVYDIVLARYVEKVDSSRLMEGAYRGAVESVFDQNSYIPAAIMDQLNTRMLEPGQVGIRVAKRGGYAVVVHVVPGSEADREGIVPGTVIQKINGKYTWDLSLFATRAMLHGMVGQPVALTYYAMETGDDVDRTLHYETLPKETVSPVTLEKDIDVLRVQEFGPEVLMRARTFAASHPRLVLDLRYNQSRDYEHMMKLAATILQQPVTITVHRRANTKSRHAAPAEPIGKPVVVLISSFTMNAGEVFANLVKGHNGVTLIGNRTSGKAFEMEVIQLPSGSFVEMATVLVAPSGGDKGLKPDIRSYIDDSEIVKKLRALDESKDGELHGDQTAA